MAVRLAVIRLSCGVALTVCQTLEAENLLANVRIRVVFSSEEDSRRSLKNIPPYAKVCAVGD